MLSLTFSAGNDERMFVLHRRKVQRTGPSCIDGFQWAIKEMLEVDALSPNTFLFLNALENADVVLR